MFEYFTKIYRSFDALQQGLTEKGKENWRLHTCDRIEEGLYLVVMDKVTNDDSESEISEEKEAMVCKG